ncbi:hypothetical protein QTI66_32980 [Variovorax sp. J22R133]|nr:hypothetical protein [Variovorax sp. J22R133]MDM0116944.1 hypothetical protein [Variovorax sp. J22R133]
MVDNLDQNIGRLIQHLKDNGAEDSDTQRRQQPGQYRPALVQRGLWGALG